MRALLFGAGGLLGRALQDAAPASVELLAHDHQATDITDADAVRHALRDARPAIVINAAAYTAVDRAEQEPDRAMLVNGESPGLIGREARQAGARVLHFGSDYVFDGRGGAPYAEGAPTAPLGAYGRSKLAGEHALVESGADALIVRTQWLFGADRTSFPSRMWARAQAGDPTRVVADQRGRPTAADDLAHAVWRLVQHPASGVLHVAGGGEATWHDVAALVFARAGRSDLLTPCSTAEFASPAPRPPDSRLDTRRAVHLLGAELPHWRDSLARCLERLAHGA